MFKTEQREELAKHISLSWGGNKRNIHEELEGAKDV